MSESYKVVMLSGEGKTITEIIPAENESQLIGMIKSRGYYTISYEKLEEVDVKRGKLKLKTLSLFCYQLYAMSAAGVSLLDALNLIQSKARNAKEAKIFRNLYETIQTGNSLSTAMKAQEGSFDPLLISMVESGESSGALTDVLQTMSKQYDSDLKLNNKLRTATTYPVILFTISVLVVLLLVTFVLPGITANFQSGDMPITTRFLLAISNFLINQWYIVVLFIILVIGLFMYMLNTRETRIRIFKMILYFPIIGKLVRTIYSARCARSFASLYHHGVNALDMIELTSHVLGNAYLEDAFNKVYVDVSRGEDISTSIAQIPEFDPMLSSMIKVGEETGSLDKVLTQTAVYFDEESQAAITTMIGYLEPVMLITMGLVIGFIVISIMQPMFQMYQTVQ